MLKLFDAEFYLKQNPDVAATVENDNIPSALHHFVYWGAFEERSPSPLFDPVAYLEANPDVAEAIANGQVSCAIDHFQRFGLEEGRDPSPFFDSDYYLESNPDVAEAVARGEITAFDHFVTFGQSEARDSSPFLDISAYLDANPDVAEAVARGETTAYDHFVTFGFQEGRDIGNGLSLAFFAADPEAQAAIAAGDFNALFARVAEVAPFAPDYQPPAGYTIPANQPIPQGFVPPEGQWLVVPEGVTPPADLPPSFETPEEPTPQPEPTPTPPSGGGGGTPVDTTAPAAPTITGFTDDSGVAGDGITNDPTPTLTITAESGSTVRVSNGTELLGTATETATKGTFTFTPNAPDQDGTYVLTATATDAAENTSKPSAQLEITIDTTADADEDLEVSVADSLVNNAEKGSVAYTVAGLDAGATAAVTFTDVNADTVVVSNAGTSGNADLSTLADGAITVSVVATDASGNTANGATGSTALDTTAPGNPDILSITAGESAFTVDFDEDIGSMNLANGFSVFIDDTELAFDQYGDNDYTVTVTNGDVVVDFTPSGFILTQDVEIDIAYGNGTFADTAGNNVAVVAVTDAPLPETVA